MNKAETWKKQLIAAAEREKEREYWLNKLSGEWEKSYFPYDSEKNKQGQNGPGTDTAAFKITGEIYTRLWQICKEADYTLNIVLQAVLIALLAKYTGNSDIVVGTVIYKQEKKGEYINTVLALRNSWQEGFTFKELLYRVRQTLVQANENRNYPIGVVVDRLKMPGTRDGDFPLFDVAILLENIHDKSGLQSIPHHMTFSFKRENQALHGNLEYTAARYHKSTIERIIGHYTRLLEQAVKKVESPLSLINILSEEETRQLLTEFNGPAMENPRHLAIHHLYEQQVETNPDHIALVGLVPENPGDRFQLTYRELNEKSHDMACQLGQKGIRTGEIVGIMVERSIGMIVGILGILKAGGAYLPIDPAYPEERKQYMLNDSGAKILLTGQEIAGLYSPQALYLSEGRHPDFPASPLPNFPASLSSSLAYVIYTSGSTGKPKGVMVEHRGVVRLVYKPDYINFLDRDRLLLTGPFIFDITTFEIWAPLINRVALYLEPGNVILGTGTLEKVLHRYGITILHLIPRLFSQAAAAGPGVFSRLRYLLVGGDLVRPESVNRVRKQNPNLEILHMYGPTENTTFTTFLPVDRDYETRIPLGKPIKQTTVYILDKNNRMQPLGVTGELVTGGQGIARGYMNNPELTAKKFDREINIKVPTEKNHNHRSHRFHRSNRSYKSNKSYTLYKTGDLARWLPGGIIEFLGRIDQQVKIRGFRIEVGEIERCLQQHKEVKDAVVTARQDENGDKYLCAYIISKKSLTVREMREYLSARLPAYMVPAYFIRLEKIPLTTSGKVDREVLEVEGAKLDIGSRYEAPRDELEKAIAAIWQEVLRVEKVGIHDNFFEIGGDSFKAMTIARKFEEQLEEMVSIASTFDYPTISTFAHYYNEVYPYAAARLREGSGRGDMEKRPSRVEAAIIAQAYRLKQPFITRPVKGTGKNRAVIFILSPRRSGSTLLRVILAGHPGLFAPQELDLLQYHTLEEKKSFTHTCIQAIMQIKGCSSEEARQIIQHYQQQHMTTREFYRRLQEWLGHRVLVDKTPAYALDIEILKQAETDFENALYLHLIRHPHGMIRSFQEVKFDIPESCRKWQDLSLTRSEIAELEWIICHRNTLEFLKQVPPRRQYRVSFEELVKEPQIVVKGICEFLEIDFQPQMLEPYKERNQRMTEGIIPGQMIAGDPKFHQHKKIDAAVADTWKKYYTVDLLGKETWKTAVLLGCKPPGKKGRLTIKPVEKKDRYPLASAQERYYIMEQLSGAGMSYHISSAVQLQGRIEKEQLETAMKRLIQRHESLRTSFETVEEEILQIIHDRVEFKIENYTAAGGKQQVKEIAKNFPRPFDLTRAPLFRAGLINLKAETHILMIDMHHLITDGVSAGVFIEDFTALYAGRDLPEIRIRYKDYAQWQDKLTGSREIKKQEDYWLECFKGEIPRLNMPGDFPGTGENRYEGSTIRVRMEHRLVTGINRLIKERAATMNIVLMAVYAVLLSKYTGQEEIIIGTLTTGRNHEEIQNIIGLFTNSLAIRNFPEENKIFEIYLGEVKKNMLEAYENQDYQFNDLVWKLGDRVETRGTPLYSTIITIQNIEIPVVEIPGLEITSYPLGQETAKFPFYFDVYHDEETVELAMKYSTGLYKSSTAERIVRDYIEILDQVVKKKDISIKDIKISLSSAEIERNQFKEDLEEFNF